MAVQCAGFVCRETDALCSMATSRKLCETSETTFDKYLCSSVTSCSFCCRLCWLRSSEAALSAMRAFSSSKARNWDLALSYRACASSASFWACAAAVALEHQSKRDVDRHLLCKVLNKTELHHLISLILGLHSLNNHESKYVHDGSLSTSVQLGQGLV